MNKYIFLIISIIIGLFLPIENYVELNHLMIVETIGIDCTKNYHLYLKEIIPEKGNNDITYKYKIYQSTGKSLKASYLNIKKHTSKKIFTKYTKYIITNCPKPKIFNFLDHNNSTIIHTKKNIKKELTKS